MSGEMSLGQLLSGLKPYLLPDTYVFCTLADGSYGALSHAKPLASCMEEEGLTLVLPREAADREQLPYEGTFRCIRLQVHSSLLAVGLTAAVSGLLAQHNISANLIAAYHHDHVLVPAERAEESMKLLLLLQGGDGS
jgi:hypothetical protein